MNWFKSHLTNKKQITITNGYGVPQGSIQEAFLFLIYINDTNNVLQKCELYEDDTLIFIISETDAECEINLKFVHNNVNKWLKMNKLKLNEDKTKIMEINMNNNSDMEINNKIVEKVEKIKYISFIIDNRMNFKYHRDYMKSPWSSR